ncbi:MAG: ATP-binding cassette domain-containing protein [Anaerolineae bacterium]|nr:ATP-binding cassette domain-containing protein [Anaerolineae bacterium]
MSDPVATLTCLNCWQPVTAVGSQFCPVCGVHLGEWLATTVPPPDPTTANLIALHRSPITIGRGADNDVRLNHPAVSERHTRLEWRAESGVWFVVDEASARGTFINYRQVSHGPEGQAIQPATDTLWIAPYAFRLAGDEQSPSPTSHFEPAHLRLDTQNLVRTVKHAGTGKTTPILNLETTPLSFRPGEFTALVGGSGAGKTTLMKALLGLEVAQQGTVYVSGRPFIENGQSQRFAAMHTVVGYVPQDDIVHRELTPLEALDYVARFRLSPDLSREERLAYIQETLATVELWPHRHKLIRQLSGGQRKRVNIALELLAQPRLLFLDEPTSGLDPGLDLAMMELLRHWATDPADPRTIILVTHATENVTACKYVAFLAPGGYVAYFGPPQKALAFFGVNRFAEIYRLVGQYQPPGMAAAPNGDNDGAAPPDVQELVNRFQASRDHFQFVESRRLAESAVSPQTDAPPSRPANRLFHVDAATRQRFGRQLGVLTGRYFKLIRRDRMNFMVMLAQGLLVAGLLLAVARPDTFQVKGAENAQTVLFIMACAAVWLGILNATKEIVKEQDIYGRERRYGLNAAAYVLSKLLVLAAIGAFQMGTLLFITSWQITFPGQGALTGWSPAWLEWFITLELALMAGLALGLFLSASTRTVDAATAVMFVLLLIQVMFAGLFFQDAAWADVLSNFTFSRWALEGVGTTADLNGLLAGVGGASYRPDAAYTFTPLHLLARWGVLFGYVVLFTVVASLQQARKR